MSKSYVSKKCIGLFAALILFISAACFTVCAYEINTEIRVGINFTTTALDQVSVSTGEGRFNIYVEGQDNPVNIDVNMLNLSVHNGVLYVKTIFGGDVVYAGNGVKIKISPNNTENGLTINDKHYYGSFEFYADNNGKITVVNVIDIEQYIKGVLPSEIYPSWKMEALKAAAIVSRTFALRNATSSSHASLGFDVCNNTHCQMYEGTKKEHANTNAAIDETCGMVLMFDGKLAMTPYHSSTGGETASAAEVWGSNPQSYPYLTKIFNPFEDYRNVPNGKWQNIVLPANIITFIPVSYAAKLSGGNLSFEYDNNGGFINSMTVTDSLGNQVSLTTSSQVRNFFGRLVNSSNFGIGRTYIPSDSYSPGISVITASGEYDLTGIGGFEYITADGVKTAAGLTEVYVFDGKGYGHGVGLSQFGSRDMANAGFNYYQILMTYFPGTELVSIKEQQK